MRIFSPLAAVAAVLLVSGVASALSAGTVFNGTIQQTITTANATVGQRVTIANANAPGAGISNATLYGTVTHVVSAGQGRAAQLRINLNQLRLSNGTTYAINGVVTSWTAVTKNNTLKEVGGALAGMIAGNILGKVIFHTGVGGLAGAASGYMLARNNKENMVVSSGSKVQVELLSARRQSGIH